MQTDFVAVPPFWTVGQVIDHMREAEDLPDTFSDIYVVDPTYHVVGSVDLSRLLRTKRDRCRWRPSWTRAASGAGHGRSGSGGAPIRALRPEVGAGGRRQNRRLVGVVTVDDVVEVIEEEAEEDLRRLAGVGDERVIDSVRQIAPAALRLAADQSADGDARLHRHQALFDATIGQWWPWPC